MTNDEWRVANGSSLDLQQAFGKKERYRRTAVRRFVASPYLEGAHRRTALRRFVAGLSLEGAHRRTAVRRAIIPLAHHFNGGQAKKLET